MNKVKLDTGYITGAAVNQAGREFHLYKGIPYAAPPVGEFRWKPPQPAASWSGVRTCTEFSIQAAQYPDPYSADAAKKKPSGEDCLYLNILTPAEKAADKLPVMLVDLAPNEIIPCRSETGQWERVTNREISWSSKRSFPMRRHAIRIWFGSDGPRVGSVRLVEMAHRGF
jgi:hypothetical protein